MQYCHLLNLSNFRNTTTSDKTNPRPRKPKILKTYVRARSLQRAWNKLSKTIRSSKTSSPSKWTIVSKALDFHKVRGGTCSLWTVPVPCSTKAKEFWVRIWNHIVCTRVMLIIAQKWWMSWVIICTCLVRTSNRKMSHWILLDIKGLAVCRMLRVRMHRAHWHISNLVTVCCQKHHNKMMNFRNLNKIFCMLASSMVVIKFSSNFLTISTNRRNNRWKDTVLSHTCRTVIPRCASPSLVTMMPMRSKPTHSF